MTHAPANERSGRTRPGARVFALILGGLILAVLAWAAWRWSRRSSELTVVDPAASDTASTGFRSARLWFVARSGEALVSEPREVIEQAGLHERVAALLDELVRGPTGAGLTLLPAGTTLRHAYLDERGLLTLDLSGVFRSGFRGGAGAEELAVGALVRTLGDNLPGVKWVMIVCEGVPLASLGGHLPLDRPLELADWP
jgi:spore germination protein GerM